MALSNAAEGLNHESCREASMGLLPRISERIAAEFALQRMLLHDEMPEYQLVMQPLSVKEVFDELRQTYSAVVAGGGAELRIIEPLPQCVFDSDLALLLRILGNMLKNAVEASGVGCQIKLWAEEREEGLRFCVQNGQRIPKDVSVRIFERNFSTKSEPGRGLGTYAMRLLGEHFLKGRVDFDTSDDGTIFHLTVPFRR
jgi:signal transduction histidine kinase